MSRNLFAAERAQGNATEIRTNAPFSGKGYEPVSMLRSYTCPVPECAEPDGVTVDLHWEPGIGELGVLAGWVAGNVAPHCGCTLTAREMEELRSRAQDGANGC